MNGLASGLTACLEARAPRLCGLCLLKLHGQLLVAHDAHAHIVAHQFDANLDAQLVHGLQLLSSIQTHFYFI